jgi:hypothetical protein
VVGTAENGEEGGGTAGTGLGNPLKLGGVVGLGATETKGAALVLPVNPREDNPDWTVFALGSTVEDI